MYNIGPQGRAAMHNIIFWSQATCDSRRGLGAMAGVTVGANPGRKAHSYPPPAPISLPTPPPTSKPAWESRRWWWFRIKEPPVQAVPSSQPSCSQSYSFGVTVHMALQTLHFDGIWSKPAWESRRWWWYWIKEPPVQAVPSSQPSCSQSYSFGVTVHMALQTLHFDGIWSHVGPDLASLSRDRPRRLGRVCPARLCPDMTRRVRGGLAPPLSRVLPNMAKPHYHMCPTEKWRRPRRPGANNSKSHLQPNPSQCIFAGVDEWNGEAGDFVMTKLQVAERVVGAAVNWRMAAESLYEARKNRVKLTAVLWNARDISEGRQHPRPSPTVQAQGWRRQA
ncbi:hypothetical protein B0H13DRAFT_2578956 [Mycena leptocephala]|nr:hypothetical protein B0H13DRAFT_2578956 [Mycena leptocephala]